MRGKLLTFCAVLSVIMFLAGCGESWEEYVSDNAGFVVEMPREPEVKSGFERTGATSSLTTTTYTAAPAFSGESYLVYIGKYSNWSMGGVEFDQEKGKQGMRQAIRQQGGTIISEGPASLAGRDAWEYKIRVQGLTGSLRVFVEDMTIYGLQELHEEGRDVAGNAGRFFSSFRLGEEG